MANKVEEISMATGGGHADMDLIGAGDDDAHFCFPHPPYFLSTLPATACSSPHSSFHGHGAFAQSLHPSGAALATGIPSSSMIISGSEQEPKKKGGFAAGEQRKLVACASAPAAISKKPRARRQREKLGEKIAALQKLVSPYGKSDTASVLHETLCHIRFLQGQVQTLSSPYMHRLPPSRLLRLPPATSSSSSSSSSSSLMMMAAGAWASDLRSRGLCLVPLPCAQRVAGDDGNSGGAHLCSPMAAEKK